MDAATVEPCPVPGCASECRVNDSVLEDVKCVSCDYTCGSLERHNLLSRNTQAIDALVEKLSGKRRQDIRKMSLEDAAEILQEKGLLV